MGAQILLFRHAALIAIVAIHVAGCGGKSQSSSEAPVPPESSIGGAATSSLAESPGGSSSEPSEDTPPRRSQQDRCVQLAPPQLQADSDDLQITFGCGSFSATGHELSGFLGGGQKCEASGDLLNTFALKLSGSAAEKYSAVVRCGYIRYDNGTFVGGRVEVEARDGNWCHELALEKIELVDRMLLTDVSFRIEAKQSAPERDLAVRFETRSGWTAATPAEDSLCAYVAYRAPGNWACDRVPPVPSCVCPCGPSWEDFFDAMSLSLATHDGTAPPR
jgi:hypothetical protein